MIVKPPDRKITELLHERRRDADVVFLGLMEPERGEESEYAERIMALAEGFKTTIFVRSAGEFAGKLI